MLSERTVKSRIQGYLRTARALGNELEEAWMPPVYDDLCECIHRTREAADIVGDKKFSAQVEQLIDDLEHSLLVSQMKGVDHAV